MKLMFYINTLSYGGAERVIVNLANQFCKKGYDVVFVTTYSKEKEYKLNGGIGRKVLLERENYNFFKKNLFCIKRLREILSVEKPDIMISFMAEPNFRALVSCLGMKTKNLISIRNNPDCEYPNLLFKFCAKFLYRFADGVVFQTTAARDWFPSKIKEKSEIIFNQVNKEFFAGSEICNQKDVVTVGRLVEQKNHKLLIEAFARIKDKVNENLVIYGEGNIEELKKIVNSLDLSERVYFKGVTSDVPNAIKNAKLFVLSSDYEGMPNALIEAMTLGLPCISTDCPCGGPRELFADQKNGLLVPVGDETELAEKIFYLLDNDKERNKLAKNAKEFSKAFSPDIVFGKWEAYVNKIINQ